jgi:SAM-dependent methyltransferase
MVVFRRLEILTISDDGRIEIQGLPAHPPLRGPAGEYLGHEWSRWRYDSLDERIDRLLADRRGRGIDVLDLGCATGAKAAHFAGAGHRVTAVDLVDRSQDIAARNDDLTRNHAQSSPIRFLRCDVRHLRALRFAERFDLVHARRLINFMTIGELQGMFGAVGRVLKQDGLFALSFIASEADQAGAATTLAPRGSKPSLPLCPGMAAHHLDTVSQALRESGLLVVEGFTDRLVEVGLIARLAGGPESM